MNRHLKVLATDDYPLAAILFEPEGLSKGVILLCPGLGIPKEYYVSYCSFLEEQGYVSLVFDYRGINKMDGHNTDYEINLRNWGIKDIPGALEWLRIHYPEQKIYFFGHSIGGQIAGLIPNHHLVDRYIFFSSTGGYWRTFDFPLNLFTWFMFHIHIPVIAHIFGYLPKSLTYRGVRIAKGVALEWAAWSRKKNYIAAFFDKEISNYYYENITRKIDWIWFEDDKITTDRSLKSMMDYYKNATIQIHSFDPEKLGLSRIGHAGFFRPEAKEVLWKYPMELIMN